MKNSKKPFGQDVIAFFHRKKIVYSKDGKVSPGQFYKAVEINGKKYLRCIYTNQNVQGGHPMYDIPVYMVAGIRIMHSPFQLWLMGLFGIKPSKKIKLHPFSK